MKGSKIRVNVVPEPSILSIALAHKVICRPIGDADIGALVDLLTQGFPGRNRHYWMTGFERLKSRSVPPNMPRYGMMLERDGRPVGLMLLLFSSIEGAEGVRHRCNLSSWYVAPEFAAHAGSLVLHALRRRAVTYTNISAAVHTLDTVKAVGFQPYTTGYFIALPALRRRIGKTRIHVVRRAEDTAPFENLPERDLLIDHAAMDCLCIVVEQDGMFHPFVFLRFRIRDGRWPLPIQQLIYCRQMEDFVRFAGPIGRFLLRRGTPFVAHDTDGTQHALPGFFRPQAAPRYFRGTDRPRLGDLSYSERVVFGP